MASDVMTITGQEYLIIADYFSRWVEVALLEDESMREVIKNLNSFFSRTSYPE